MRIIAGEYRGLTLKCVGSMATRPTQDRVREALFSILGDHVENARVLDLYAGTGALGLESLSRGALSATFVEMSRSAVVVLEANIQTTRSNVCRVLPLPVDRAIRKLASSGEKFNLVFMDPPYGKGLVPWTLEALLSSGVVEPGARIVAEHEIRGESPKEMGDWFRTDLRKYGDTAISIYSSLSGHE